MPGPFTSEKMHTIAGEQLTYHVIGIVLFMLLQFAIIFMLLAQRRRNRQVEQALRTSEATYRLLAENVTDVIWTVNRQLQPTYVSPSIEKLSGWTPKEWLTRDIRTFMTPQAWDLVQQVFDQEARLARQADYDWNRTVVFEAEHYRKDGDHFWAEITGRLMRSEDGEIVGAIGVTRDITERKRAEEAIRESEAKFRTIFENAPVAIVINRLSDGTILDVNRKYAEITGFSKAAIVGKKTPRITRFVDSSDAERIRQEYIEHGRLDNYYLRVFDHDEDIRHELISIYPIIWADEVCTVSLVTNITDLKQAEDALRESEERLRSFIEQTSEGVMIVDEDGRIIEWNMANERISGFSRTDVLGQYYWDIVIRAVPRERRTSERRAQLEHMIREALRTGQPVFTKPTDFEFERPDGERRITQQIIFPIKTTRGYCFGSLSHDITERKRTEQELRQYREQLEQLVKTRTIALEHEIEVRKQAEEELRQAKEAAEAANRAKSAFLANMSHELRTPLNAILGFAQLLSRDSELSPVQREYLGTINRSGEHLLQLINDVLDISKIEAGRITLNCTSFDLWQMLANVEEMIRVRTAPNGLSFSVQRMPDVPRFIRTDENKLRQVLINLLGNAVKFTEKGGIQLTIRKAEIIPHSQFLLLNFSVVDTGPGIAPADLNVIFEAFCQTSHAYGSEGAGLGLTISRRFVQLLGGDIHVQSEVGRGSTFTFEIQAELVERDALPASSSMRNVLSLAPNQPLVRILVVEDQAENRQFLIQLLRSTGFDVYTAANGQEAVTQAEQWSPHLVLMDMRMPVMDGYQATKRIRKLEGANSVPIIALTASVFEEAQQQILAAGCNALLRKPVSAAELFETIRSHLHVQYVYEEEFPDVKNDCRTETHQDLTPETLTALPSDLIDALEQSVMKGNPQMIAQVIEAIRLLNPALAERIAKLAQNFKYQLLWSMVQQVKSPGQQKGS